MKILLRFVLLFVVLSVQPFAFSYSKRTAADVFFDFVVAEVGADRLEEAMGSDWIENVIHRTRFWIVSDAENFLDSLTASRISQNDILRIIRDTNYLQYLKEKQVSFEFFRESDENVGNGTSVFIEFAEANYQHLGRSFEEAMGHNWKSHIAECTRSWTYQDAKNFFLILERRIGIRTALEKIRSLPYFLDASYPQFINRLHFFQREEYLGVDRVTHQLRRDLSGFVLGGSSIDEIIFIISFLKAHGFNSADIKTVMRRDIEALTRGDIREMNAIVEELRGKYDFSEDEITIAMKKDVEAFTRGDIGKMNAIIEELRRKYGFSEDEIIIAMKRDVAAFTRGDIGKMNAIVEELRRKYGFSEDEITIAMKRDVEAFTRGDIGKMNAIVEELRRKYGFNEDEVTIAMKKDVGAFTQGKIKKMDQILNKMKKEIGFVDPEIKEMLEKNVGAFAYGDVRKMNLVIIKLKDLDFENFEIKRAIMQNPWAFTHGDAAQIVPIARRLQEYGFTDVEVIHKIKRDVGIFTLGRIMKMDTVINRMKARGINDSDIRVALRKDIRTFTRADIKKMDRVINRLKARGFNDIEITEAMRRSPGSFIGIEDHMEDIVRYLEGMRQQCAQSLLKRESNL